MSQGSNRSSLDFSRAQRARASCDTGSGRGSLDVSVPEGWQTGPARAGCKASFTPAAAMRECPLVLQGGSGGDASSGSMPRYGRAAGTHPAPTADVSRSSFFAGTSPPRGSDPMQERWGGRRAQVMLACWHVCARV